jgi:hypothetical protein
LWSAAYHNYSVILCDRNSGTWIGASLTISDPAFLNSRTPKQYFSGTHRAISPAETWDRIQPLLRRFGITRVADITGLDRIGVPVATAVRPMSRSIAVAAGKGVDLVAAKVSAAMEAIEWAHAERIDRPLFLGSRFEIAAGRQTATLSHLPLLAGAALDDQTPLLWIEGRSLAEGAPVMVPYELVHAHYCPLGLPVGDLQRNDQRAKLRQRPGGGDLPRALRSDRAGRPQSLEPASAAAAQRPTLGAFLRRRPGRR